MAGFKVCLLLTAIVFIAFGFVATTDIDHVAVNATHVVKQPVTIEVHPETLTELFEDAMDFNIHANNAIIDESHEAILPTAPLSEVNQLEEPDERLALTEQTVETLQTLIAEPDGNDGSQKLPPLNELHSELVPTKELMSNVEELWPNYAYYQDFGVDQIDVDPPIDGYMTPGEEYDVLDQLQDDDLMLADDGEFMERSAERSPPYVPRPNRKLAVSVPVGMILNDEARGEDGYQSDKQFVSLRPKSRDNKPVDVFIDGLEWFIEDELEEDSNVNVSIQRDDQRQNNVEKMENTNDNVASMYKHQNINQVTEKQDLVEPLPNAVRENRLSGDRYSMGDNYEKSDQNTEEQAVNEPFDRRRMYNAKQQNYHDGAQQHRQHARREYHRDRFAFSPRLLRKFNREPFVNELQSAPVKHKQDVFLGASMQWQRLPDGQMIPERMTQPRMVDASRHYFRKTTDEVRKVLQMAKEISAVDMSSDLSHIDSNNSPNSMNKINVAKDSSSTEGLTADSSDDMVLSNDSSTTNFTFEGLIQQLQYVESNGSNHSAVATLRKNHHISLLRLILKQLSMRQFTWWDLLIASSVTIGCVLFLLGLATVIQLCVRHCDVHCCHCCSRSTEYSPSIKQASSNGTIYDVDYTLDSLQMISRQRRRAANKQRPCISCWWGFTSCCTRSATSASNHSSASSTPNSLRSATDMSVVSAEMGTQYEHSDAMISSFVTNDLVVELNDRDSTYTSTTEGFEYYSPDHSDGGGGHSLGREAHSDYKIGVTEF